MRLSVKVIPAASRNLFKEEDGIVKVYLTAPPVEGKANQALIKFLGRHYGVNKSAVTIVKGEKSRHKVIEINR